MSGNIMIDKLRGYHQKTGYTPSGRFPFRVRDVLHFTKSARKLEGKGK
jgi:hypothetical protein